MATLVLSTVGTILGGPIGGAIGSLVGQSIDQQLFGPGARQGPKLGDLSVQTSSYGSAIPRVFGTMRVAGTIVWATDLQEQANRQSAKGQPDSVTYAYSVSFAVALSSRQIAGVGRIWADGKLIRNADGQFAVATGFRILDGSEDQQPDPLIASVEGIGSTPAFRGIALAVFENLQLADFGNRIPFLTFELIADPAPVGLGAILTDVSDGAIAVDASQSIAGYAAYGASVKAALQPLADLWDLPLFDDGSVLTSAPPAAAVAIGDGETGCTAQARPAPRSERSQVQASKLPTSATLAYYDPDRDYQTGLARASLDSRARLLDQIELPAVLAAGAAKGLVETSLARAWAERDRLTLRLPPQYIDAFPGTRFLAPAAAGTWTASRVTVDGLAVTVDLRPVYESTGEVAADPGRAAPSTAAIPAPTILRVAELPDDGSGSMAAPVVVVAANSTAQLWRPVPLKIEVGGTTFDSRTASLPALIGQAQTVLGSGQSAVLDLLNSVDVELTNDGDWLESRDDDALAAGDNLALLGNELIQFGEVTPLGNRQFRLGRLLRGRRGTEWAMDGHSAGDGFLVLEQSRLQRVPLSPAQKGAQLIVTPGGLADGGAASVQVPIEGEAMRPPGPIRLSAARDAQGNLECAWLRRSSQGWSWLDNIEVPLGCSSEQYRATLTGPAGSVDHMSSEPRVAFTAAELAAIGTGNAELSVVQVGDLAVSRPATLSITIS